MALLSEILSLMVLKMKFRVPDRTASSRMILSPLRIRSLIVLIMGNPAPTLVSLIHFLYEKLNGGLFSHLFQFIAIVREIKSVRVHKHFLYIADPDHVDFQM